MNEEDMNNWLRAQDFTKVPTQKFKIKPPDNHTFCLRKQTGQTETIILPLSLENNATLTGTAEILEEFGHEFGIPCTHVTSYLPYDNKKNKFDIESA